MGFLYKLTFPSGKSYIGITSKSIKRRIVHHVSCARRGGRWAVHAAIRKFGESSFEVQVLAEVDDWPQLCRMEVEAIREHQTKTPHGYNLSDGGEGFQGYKFTPEQRAASSRARKGKNLRNSRALGYRHTEEALRKIAEAGRGRVVSAERRAKIGKTKIGNKYNVGRIVSEEARRKSSEKQKGVPKSDSHREALSVAHKGKPWSAARRAAQEAKRANHVCDPVA